MLNQEMIDVLSKVVVNDGAIVNLTNNIGAIRNNVVRFGQHGILIQNVNLGIDRKGNVDVKYSAENYFSTDLSRTLKIAGETTELQENFGAVKYELATNKLLVVNFKMKSKTIQRIVRYLVHDFMLVRSSVLENGFGLAHWNRFPDENGNMVFKLHVIGTDEYIDVEAAKELAAKGELVKYVAFTNAPSKKRTGSMLYYNSTADVRDIEAVLDDVTYGAFSIAKEKFGDIAVAAAKVIKADTRFSQPATESTRLFKVNAFAYFMGEFNLNGVKFSDGAFFVMDASIQRGQMERGQRITLQEALSFNGQDRAAMIKGNSTPVEKTFVPSVVNEYITKGIAKGIMYLPRTREVAIDIAKHPEKYSGYFLVFGTDDIANVDIFGDLSTFKIEWDYSREIYLDLMSLPVQQTGWTSGSKQVASIVQAVDGGDKAIEEIGKATIDDIFSIRHKKVAENKQTDEDEDEDEDVKSSRDISSSDYVANSLAAICPQVLDDDPMIKLQIARARINTILKASNKLKFTMRGVQCKAVPDYACFFGVKSLKKNQVLLGGNDFPNEKGDAVRHPLVAFKEHLKVNTISLQDWKDNLAKSELPTSIVLMLEKMVSSLPSGTVMICSGDAHIYAHFSGMDLDGDTLLIIFEKKIVALMEKLPEGYTEFGEVDAATDLMKLDRYTSANAFLYAYGLYIKGREPNKSIGEVAGFANTVKSLLVMHQKGQIKSSELGKMFGCDEEGEQKEYQCMFGDNANFCGREHSFAHDFKYAVQHSYYTPVEVDRILKDLVVIISKVSNDTIDAGKKGNHVVIPFYKEIGDNVRSGIVASEDNVEFHLQPGTFELSDLQLTKEGFKHRDADDDRPNPYVLMDPLTIVKNNVVKYGYDKMHEFLTHNSDGSDFVFKGFGSDYQYQNIFLHNFLQFCSSVYANFMHDARNNKALCKESMVNMVRNVGYNVAKVDSETLLYEAASASYYGENKQNSFYLSLASETYSHYLNKYCKDMMFERKLYGFGDFPKVEVGATLTFVDGICDNTYYTSDRLNGTFTVAVNNKGEAIIRKPFVQMIPSMKRNDNRVLFVVNTTSKNHESLIASLERARASKKNVETQMFLTDKGYPRINLVFDNIMSDGTSSKLSVGLYLGENKPFRTTNGTTRFGSEMYMNLVGDKSLSIVALQGATRTAYGQKKQVLYVIADIVESHEHTVKFDTCGEIATKKSVVSTFAPVKFNFHDCLVADEKAVVNDAAKEQSEVKKQQEVKEDSCAAAATAEQESSCVVCSNSYDGAEDDECSFDAFMAAQ